MYNSKRIIITKTDKHIGPSCASKNWDAIKAATTSALLDGKFHEGDDPENAIRIEKHISLVGSNVYCDVCNKKIGAC